MLRARVLQLDTAMTTAKPGDITYRQAAATDLASIEGLLRDSALPTVGVADAVSNFVVAERGRRIVGVAGLEMHGDRFALLRSAAVDASVRGRGVGKHLVHQVIAAARARRLEALYLLTTTAERYFPMFGFEEITRDSVPEPVKRSAEFTTACPSSAVVMSLSLRDKS